MYACNLFSASIAHASSISGLGTSKLLINASIIINFSAGFNCNASEINSFVDRLDLSDVNGNILSDEQRLTKIGNYLRNLSLDELPELINVIKGDMSLVGPRPLLYEYLPRYSRYHARRHEVIPGITGWAQVNGRNELNWEERFDLDVWYVDNRSFLLDIKILISTIRLVLARKGISHPGSVTMHKFTPPPNGNRV